MAIDIQGKILTVTGAIEPADLGKTLIHEHLFFDLSCYFRPPEDERGKSLVDEPLQLSNMGWLRQNVMSSRPNLLMDDASVVEAEVGKYRDPRRPPSWTKRLLASPRTRKGWPKSLPEQASRSLPATATTSILRIRRTWTARPPRVSGRKSSAT